MKSISLLAVLIAAVCGLSACASDSTPSTSAGDPVPGQVKNSEERLSPSMGSAGPNASVKW